MITAERCIVEAIVRALSWRGEKVATDMGMVAFRDLGDVTLVADLEGVMFDVVISVKFRRSE